jgi:hypothetical protein
MPGLYAVNRDGTGFLQLAMRAGTPFITDASALRNRRDLLPWHTFLLSQHGARNSDYLYVQDRHYGGRAQIDYVNLLRVNTVTGRLAAERIDSPEHVMRWLLDFDGEPRLVQTLDKDISAIHYRDPATKTWRKLAEFNAYSGSKGLYAALVRPRRHAVRDRQPRARYYRRVHLRREQAAAVGKGRGTAGWL